jgi:predicted nucleic acid-binding protein
VPSDCATTTASSPSASRRASTGSRGHGRTADRQQGRGVLVAKTDDIRATRLRRLANIEQTFQALEVDAPVAREYGRLAAVVAAGRKPQARAMDLLIAATASAHGARLCTRNPSDLIGLEDILEIVSVN